MSEMKIWIDADACPVAIKEIVYKAARRTNTEVILVANSNMKIPKDKIFQLIVVKKGFDEADNFIVDKIDTQDLVITADIPLADRIVQKGAVAINPRGELYTEDNIKQRLSIRNFMEDLRSSGYVGGGPKQISKQDIFKFATSFDRILTKLKR